MVRRFLLSGAVLLFLLLLVPACGGDRDGSKGGAPTPTRPSDQPLPEPRPGGRPG
jgi:hypothetical protein